MHFIRKKRRTKMSNSKHTGMERLRRDKRRLKAKMELEKVELLNEIEEYKNSFWPFKVINRFRKTAESLSENKLLIIGAQLAYAALNTVKEKTTTEDSSEQKGGMKEFLKSMVNNFLQQYMKKGEEESAEE
jgi:hypothetical protein